MTCQVSGCVSRALYWVVKDNRLHVCGTCRDELMSLWGWTLATK